MQEDVQVSFCLHIPRYLHTCTYMSIYRFSWFYFWNHSSFSSPQRDTALTRSSQKAPPQHTHPGTSAREWCCGAEPPPSFSAGPQSGTHTAPRHAAGPAHSVTNQIHCADRKKVAGGGEGSQRKPGGESGAEGGRQARGEPRCSTSPCPVCSLERLYHS